MIPSADTTPRHDTLLPPAARMPTRVPSPSALNVAALRALHQTAESPPIFVDPLADPILGAGGAALLKQHRAAAGDTARLRATLAIRSVLAEDTIADAVARGIRQCVIIGAGLDTFAYRHAHRDLTIFEVDQPATQSWKRDLLRDAGIVVPSSVRYVATDLEHDDLVPALTARAFEIDEPAVCVMLGVTPYVARESLMKLLRAIACEFAAGTEVVFDYTEPFHQAIEPIRQAYEVAAARVAAAGEPWVTLFEPAALHQALRSFGFAELTDVDAAALHQRFCAHRADGLVVAALMHVIRVRT